VLARIAELLQAGSEQARKERVERMKRNRSASERAMERCPVCPSPPGGTQSPDDGPGGLAPSPKPYRGPQIPGDDLPPPPPVPPPHYWEAIPVIPDCPGGLAMFPRQWLKVTLPPHLAAHQSTIIRVLDVVTSAWATCEFILDHDWDNQREFLWQAGPVPLDAAFGGSWLLALVRARNAYGRAIARLVAGYWGEEKYLPFMIVDKPTPPNIFVDHCNILDINTGNHGWFTAKWAPGLGGLSLLWPCRFETMSLRDQMRTLIAALVLGDGVTNVPAGPDGDFAPGSLCVGVYPYGTCFEWEILWVYNAFRHADRAIDHFDAVGMCAFEEDFEVVPPDRRKPKACLPVGGSPKLQFTHCGEWGKDVVSAAFERAFAWLDPAYRFIQGLNMLDDTQPLPWSEEWTKQTGMVLTARKAMWMWGFREENRDSNASPMAWFGPLRATGGFGSAESMFQHVRYMITRLFERRFQYGTTRWNPVIFYCQYDTDCFQADSDIAGWSSPDVGWIVLCKQFFDYDEDERAETILHEMMHYLKEDDADVNKPSDYPDDDCPKAKDGRRKCYDRDNSIHLAETNQYGALHNIDNYVSWIVERWNDWGNCWPPQYDFKAFGLPRQRNVLRGFGTGPGEDSFWRPDPQE
jgi:hypothetical protein